jgi:hypothetical protein
MRAFPRSSNDVSAVVGVLLLVVPKLPDRTSHYFVACRARSIANAFFRTRVAVSVR